MGSINIGLSQDCDSCTTYNAVLGCYAVAVCDDPTASNYCPADYYINSGTTFCEYDDGCFCEGAANFGGDEDCVFVEGRLYTKTNRCIY